MYKGVEAHFIRDNFNESVRQLASLAHLSCVAECNVPMNNKNYKPSEDATASDPPPTLQSVTSKMVALKHSAMHRNIYALAVFANGFCPQPVGGCPGEFGPIF